ncbi:MAG: type IV pilin [Candidatus Hodarchaeales archaeon]
MSVLNILKNRKKAVSPVVAAILLIGLVVVAGAAVAFIVLPMINPPFTADKINIETFGSAPSGNGYMNATIQLNIANSFTSKVTLSSVTSFTFNNGSAQEVTGTATIDPGTIDAGSSAIITIVYTWTSGATFDNGDTPVSIVLVFTAGSTSKTVTHSF